MDFLDLAAYRWWQAAAHVWEREPCIPPNKARIWSLEQGISGQILLCSMVLLFAVVLPWGEPKAAVVQNPGDSFSKVCSLVFCHSKSSLNRPPPTRGGSLEFDGGFAFTVRWLKACACREILNRSEVCFFPASLCGGVGEERSTSELRAGYWRRWE